MHGDEDDGEEVRWLGPSHMRQSCLDLQDPRQLASPSAAPSRRIRLRSDKRCSSRSSSNLSSSAHWSTSCRGGRPSTSVVDSLAGTDNSSRVRLHGLTGSPCRTAWAVSMPHAKSHSLRLKELHIFCPTLPAVHRWSGLPAVSHRRGACWNRARRCRRSLAVCGRTVSFIPICLLELY